MRDSAVPESMDADRQAIAATPRSPQDDVQETRARLDLALEAGRAGAFEWEVSTGRARVSGFLIELAGADPVTGAISFERWASLVEPEDHAHIVQLTEQCVRQRCERVSYDFRLRTVRGVTWLTSHTRLYYDDTGVLQRASGVNVDITERKELELRLHEADRHKDLFIATLSHELRNPLAPIRSAVDALRLRTPPDPFIVRLHDIIERQVDHMVHLLEDLLDVSRLSRGIIVLRTEPVALTRVLEDAVEAVLPMVRSRRHRLEVTPVPDEILLEADPARLVQVFSNLLVNAARYTEPGGAITVEVTPSEESVTIAVIDTGIGLAPELLPRIFDLYTRGQETLHREGGLGIGLALTRRLVELHGGHVSAESAGPGQGSVFRVVLPRRSRAAAGSVTA